MGYTRQRRKKVINPTFALNITSMTDMFTILLVFLLQTYSTADFQLIPEDGVRLPASSAEVSPTKALKLSVSPTELKLEDKVIVSLKQGNFNATDLDLHDTNFIKPLFDALNKISKESTAEDVKEGRMVMMADSSLSYQTLRRVMYTASMAGFPKLKMATVVGD